jgi:predicted transcriptional regulator
VTTRRKTLVRRSVADTQADLLRVMGDGWRTAGYLAGCLDISPTHVADMLRRMLAAGLVERKTETEEDVRLRLYAARDEARRARVPVSRVQGPARPVLAYRAVPQPEAA